MNIGGRIRSTRRAAGLSQEEVARRAGLSLKGMGEIERGDIEDPHISSLTSIARALGVPVGTLLKEEEPVVAGKDEAPLPSGPTTGPHEWAQTYSARLHGMGDEEWDAHVRDLGSVDEIEHEFRTLLNEAKNLHAAFGSDKWRNPEDRENRISRDRRLKKIRTSRLADLASAAKKKKAEALLRDVTEAWVEEGHS